MSEEMEEGQSCWAHCTGTVNGWLEWNLGGCQPQSDPMEVSNSGV